MKDKDEIVIQTILDSCLARLQQGETIEQCLSEYPEQAEELRPLLETASVGIETMNECRPGSEFKARARYEFHTALAEAKSRKRNAMGWRLNWVTTAIGILAVFFIGSGTVAAAGYSMPNQPLYGIKIAAEEIRLTLTPSDLGKALYATETANIRISEIAYSAENDDVKGIEIATRNLEARLEKVSILAARQSGTEDATVLSSGTDTMAPALVPSPPSFLTGTGEVTTATATTPTTTATGPMLAAPASQTTTENSDNQKEAGNSRTSVSLTTSNITSTVPSQNIDKQENEKDKLKKVLTENALSHASLLERELEKASGNVKNALQKALEASTQGYAKAIKAIDD